MDSGRSISSRTKGHSRFVPCRIECASSRECRYLISEQCGKDSRRIRIKFIRCQCVFPPATPSITDVFACRILEDTPSWSRCYIMSGWNLSARRSFVGLVCCIVAVVVAVCCNRLSYQSIFRVVQRVERRDSMISSTKGSAAAKRTMSIFAFAHCTAFHTRRVNPMPHRA